MKQKVKKYIALNLLVIFLLPLAFRCIHVLKTHHIHTPLKRVNSTLVQSHIHNIHCAICEFTYTVFENNPDFVVDYYEIEFEKNLQLYSQNIPFGFCGDLTELRGPPLS